MSINEGGLATKWGAPANVASSATDVLGVNANPGRLGLVISNDSTSKLYVLFGTGVCSATNFTYVIPANTNFEVFTTAGPSEAPVYNGQVRLAWASVNGSAAITELT